MFDNFLTPLPSSSILLIRPKYCCNIIRITPSPRKTVTSFMDDPLIEFRAIEIQTTTTNPFFTILDRSGNVQVTDEAVMMLLMSQNTVKPLIISSAKDVVHNINLFLWAPPEMTSRSRLDAITSSSISHFHNNNNNNNQMLTVNFV